MFPNLPSLRILPLSLLILHEDHDQQRSLPLVNRLRAQGILRNPPIVMPLEDQSGRFMVLDGANRVTALQAMGFPHIVTQVSQPDDQQVTLMTWNHVIWGISARDLMAGIRRMGRVTRISDDLSTRNEQGGDSTSVIILLADGRGYQVRISPEPLEQSIFLNGIVETYKSRAFLDRTSETVVTAFQPLHPDLTALVIFPHFTIQTVLYLAGAGSPLPTGITRFTISPRALHLNYPLHELSSDKSIEYKQAYLDRWIQERLKQKRVRYYTEATFLFDE